MTDQLEAQFAQLKQKAQERADTCSWGARRSRYSYLRWDTAARLLLLGAAVASFLASAALLSNLAKSHRWLAVSLGVLSLFAGLLQVVYSVTEARKRADDYAQGERAYIVMRSHYLRFVETWSDSATAAHRYDQLAEEEETLNLPRPFEGWTLAKIKRASEQGERPGSKVFWRGQTPEGGYKKRW